MKTVMNDESALRAVEDRSAAAVNAGDADCIMKNYIPDKSLVVFDVVPRKEYLALTHIVRIGRTSSHTISTRQNYPSLISASLWTAMLHSVTASCMSREPTCKVIRLIGRTYYCRLS
jgi:hypothetical protein